MDNRERRLVRMRDLYRQQRPDRLAKARERYHQQKQFINQVICGESAQVLKGMPSSFVDMAICSPPYFFGMSDEWDIFAGWDDYYGQMKAVFSECVRVLKPSGRVAINISWAQLAGEATHHKLSMMMADLGLKFMHELLWEKNNCPPVFLMGRPSPKKPIIRYTWEYVLVFCKTTNTKIGSRRNIDITPDEFRKWASGKWSFPGDSRMSKKHPAPFPVELPKRLMKMFTYKGDVILDPFAGVGSTGVAAQRLGRRFILIDKLEKYCRIARRRLAQDLVLHQPGNGNGRSGIKR